MKRLTAIASALITATAGAAWDPAFADVTAEALGTGFGKKVVAATNQRGFFGLKAYAGKLFAGTYGVRGLCEIHKGQQPHIEGLSPVRNRLGETLMFDVGESIYEFEEFNGRLYASTENLGKILRHRQGEGWRLVGKIGGKAYSLAVYRDKLYVGNNHGTVYRSRTGSFLGRERMTKLASDMREMIVFNDKLYALGYDYLGGHGVIHVYDGTSWREILFEKLRSLRIMKAHVWNGSLWFTTSPYTNGRRRPPAGVWRWDGTRDPAGLVNVFNDPDRDIGMDLIDFNGRLYFSVIEKWHGDVEKGAALHRSDQGGESWDGPDCREFAIFGRFPEAWSLEVFQGNLYVSTSYRDSWGGKVFQVFTEEVCDGWDNDGDGLVDEDLGCPEEPPAL